MVGSATSVYLSSEDPDDKQLAILSGSAVIYNAFTSAATEYYKEKMKTLQDEFDKFRNPATQQPYSFGIAPAVPRDGGSTASASSTANDSAGVSSSDAKFRKV